MLTNHFTPTASRRVSSLFNCDVVFRFANSNYPHTPSITDPQCGHVPFFILFSSTKNPALLTRVFLHFQQDVSSPPSPGMFPIYTYLSPASMPIFRARWRVAAGVRGRSLNL